MPELTLKDDFHAALKNYHLSDSANQILHKTKLVVLTAPTASGRNTIINELLRTNQYNFIVSDTTRAPRENNGILEQNGREYFFRNEQDMLQDIKDGNFLEAEVIHEQQVSGISIRELAKAGEENRVAIADTDIGGISNIITLKPDAIAVLVLPPSFEVWHERIFSRGEMPDDEYGRRLKTAARILHSGIEENSIFKIIINDDLTDAAEQIHELVHNETFTPEQHEKGVALARELLAETESALALLTIEC